MFGWVKDRCKELTSLHGGAMIAVGVVVLFFRQIETKALGTDS